MVVKLRHRQTITTYTKLGPSGDLLSDAIMFADYSNKYQHGFRLCTKRSVCFSLVQVQATEAAQKTIDVYNFITHYITPSYEALRTWKCPMSLCTASSIMLINKFQMKEWRIKHNSACLVSNSNDITYTKVNKTGNVYIT